MKKEKITHYDETNFKKSPRYRKYVRQRRKEKFCHFITLPTFLWVLVFLTLSSLMLVASYFINTMNAWLSGVLISIACGIITGVILYFLSNLRNAKLYVIERNYDEFYNVYKLLEDVLFKKIMCDNTMALGMDLDWGNECSEIMGKLECLKEALDPWGIEHWEEKEGLEDFAKKVYELCNQFELLSTDADRQEWIFSIESTLEPIRRIMSVILAEYCDRLRYMKNYFV